MVAKEFANSEARVYGTVLSIEPWMIVVGGKDLMMFLFLRLLVIFVAPKLKIRLMSSTTWIGEQAFKRGNILSMIFLSSPFLCMKVFILTRSNGPEMGMKPLMSCAERAKRGCAHF